MLELLSKFRRRVQNFLKFNFGGNQQRNSRPIHVGWVVAGSLKGQYKKFEIVGPPVSMRVCNIALWINSNSDMIWNEMYNPMEQYQVVVFMKAMDEICQGEAKKIQNYGGKVIFDANVNYYEVWGNYDIPGTKPTQNQTDNALAMTALADWVVADSNYLMEIIGKFTDRVTWIPDNVDMQWFPKIRAHEENTINRLVWCGVAKKAKPLLSISSVLSELKTLELILVSDTVPDVMQELSSVVNCRYVPYRERTYPKLLLECDCIISPKVLTNGYEMAHTEYKITLGMAAGLPAVASPQRSYKEAIDWMGGGIIADSEQEWLEALNSLIHDVPKRTSMGQNARNTVLERYSTPIVAQQYLKVLEKLAGKLI